MEKRTKVKVFTCGQSAHKAVECVQHLEEQNTNFLNISNLELKNLKENVKLLEETDVAVVVGEVNNKAEFKKIEYIIKKTKAENILTILILSVENKDEVNRRNLEKSVDVLIPVLEEKVLNGAVDGFLSISKSSVEENLVEVYLKTLLGFTSNANNQLIVIEEIENLFKNKGLAYIGYGKAFGENKCKLAAFLAINNSYSLKSIKNAKQVLINIAGNEHMGLLKVNDAVEAVVANLQEDIETLFAVTIDNSLEDAVEVSVIGI